MEFIKSNPDLPFSFAVIHNVKVLETVLTTIPPGGYGVDLQKGMLVEAGFVCEVPA